MGLQVDEFKKSIETMAAGSLRCVAFAYRRYDPVDNPSQELREGSDLPEDKLTLLGIVGIKVLWLIMEIGGSPVWVCLFFKLKIIFC